MEIRQTAGAALRQAQGLHTGLRDLLGKLFSIGGLDQQPQQRRVLGLLASKIPILDAQDTDVIPQRAGQPGRNLLLTQLHGADTPGQSCMGAGR